MFGTRAFTQTLYYLYKRCIYMVIAHRVEIICRQAEDITSHKTSTTLGFYDL